MSTTGSSIPAPRFRAHLFRRLPLLIHRAAEPDPRVQRLVGHAGLAAITALVAGPLRHHQEPETTMTMTAPQTTSRHTSRAGDRLDPPDIAILVEDATVQIGRRTTLSSVDLAVPAGSLVAIAGGSGAGKTTLLEVMAGVRRPTTGRVRLGHSQRPAHLVAGSGQVGLVPQDDIIHRDLPLRRTLLHASRLRLDRRARTDATTLVAEVLDRLGLADRADVKVGSLSGGQRKRASIAVELLTHPEVLFLDEPTSGLDPVSADEMVGTLRALTHTGMTVVMTTHDPAEIARCDRVVFLAPHGRLCFDGTPDDAKRHFEVEDMAAVYPLVSGVGSDDGVARWSAARPDRPTTTSRPGHRPHATDAPDRVPSSRATPLRQWAVLTSRSAEVVVRNQLTLAILLGSPALVITMMAVLFPAGAFDTADPGSIGPTQTTFWMAFAAFFFGLTYGLLQIVTERAVLHRERFAGLSLTAYLAAKVTLLMPVLAGVAFALLAVLRLLDRLPTAGWRTYAELLATLVLVAAAGLLLGLAASAAVADPAQATLALPMICFPQVLFAGAVVPVDQMAGAGAGISAGMATRWAFESLGRTLFPGPAAEGPYQQAFTGPVSTGWILLAVIIGVATVASIVALQRTTARPGR